MRKKNEKLIKMIGIFKFKKIRKRLESVILEKGKSFMQQKVTKWKKKIRHENLPKHSDLLWKRKHGIPWSQ